MDGYLGIDVHTLTIVITCNFSSSLQAQMTINAHEKALFEPCSSWLSLWLIISSALCAKSVEEIQREIAYACYVTSELNLMSVFHITKLPTCIYSNDRR